MQRNQAGDQNIKNIGKYHQIRKHESQDSQGNDLDLDQQKN